MNCACGRPVYVKKRSLCQRCYQRARYQSLIPAEKLNNPRWKKKTAPNPLRRITAVERRAALLIAKDAPIIQGLREHKTLTQIASELGISRARVHQRIGHWGLTRYTFGTAAAEKARKAEAERSARAVRRRGLLVAKFWSNVDRRGMEECWMWLGATCTPNNRFPNYLLPRFTSGQIAGEPHSAFAYRVAYRLTFGDIPKGMTVDHICFNPMCCNPAHLQLLTRAENSARKDPSKKAAAAKATSEAMKRLWAERKARSAA